MEQRPRPVEGDRNRGTTLLAISWTEAVICIVFVAIRFYARSMIKAVGKDDWIMMITLVSRTFTPSKKHLAAAHLSLDLITPHSWYRDLWSNSQI